MPPGNKHMVRIVGFTVNKKIFSNRFNYENKKIRKMCQNKVQYCKWGKHTLHQKQYVLSQTYTHTQYEQKIMLKIKLLGGFP